MASNEKSKENRSSKITVALERAIQKVIAETKAKNSYMVVSDKKGNIIKIPAKDL